MQNFSHNPYAQIVRQYLRYVIFVVWIIFAIILVAQWLEKLGFGIWLPEGLRLPFAEQTGVLVLLYILLAIIDKLIPEMNDNNEEEK